MNCITLIFTMGLIWLIHQFYRIFKNYKRLNVLSTNLPGEYGLPFIGQLLRFKNIHDVMDIAYNAFIKFNSPTKAFVGPTLVVCFSDPNQIQTILNSTYAVDKLPEYKFCDDFHCEGFNTASHDRWKVTRKLLNPTFHQEILQNNVIFLEQSNKIVEQLKYKSDKGYFDVSRLVMRNVIESVSQTLLGFIVNNDDANIDFCSTIEIMTSSMLKRGLNPFLYCDFVYNRTNLKQKYTEAGTKLRNYLLKVLNFKRKEITVNDSTQSRKRKTFISKLIEISQTSDIYTENQLLGEIITIFVAATDTTSVGIGFTLVMLGIHKDVQTRVYLEILEILGDTRKPIIYEDLKRMVYLERFIKEVFRLYLPVPFFARNITADIPIGKHTLPRGSKCIISPYVLHRNPDVWPDPEKLNPDRFLTEAVKKRHPYSYLPFAGGHRTCIGKGYAVVYIKTVIASILRTFEISYGMPEKDLKLKFDAVIKLQDGFNISVVERC